MMMSGMADGVTVIYSFGLPIGAIDLLKDLSLLDVIVLHRRDLYNVGDEHIDGCLT